MKVFLSVEPETVCSNLLKKRPDFDGVCRFIIDFALATFDPNSNLKT